MLQPSCQYGVYPVRRVLRPLSPCAFICHTLTQSRHRPTRCFVEGGRLAVACSRFRSAARLKVRLFVGRVSSTGAHDPKQLYGASVDLSSPVACPSRARPWDVRVELFFWLHFTLYYKANLPLVLPVLIAHKPATTVRAEFTHNPGRRVRRPRLPPTRPD